MFKITSDCYHLNQACLYYQTQARSGPRPGPVQTSNSCSPVTMSPFVSNELEVLLHAVKYRFIYGYQRGNLICSLGQTLLRRSNVEG
jgi:hypothetical protein